MAGGWPGGGRKLTMWWLCTDVNWEWLSFEPAFVVMVVLFASSLVALSFIDGIFLFICRALKGALSYFFTPFVRK